MQNRRHTFATRLRAAGVHAFDVGELMGHTTLSATVNYHASPEAMRRAVERLRELRAQMLEFPGGGPEHYIIRPFRLLT